jgi:hypothetical protein
MNEWAVLENEFMTCAFLFLNSMYNFINKWTVKVLPRDTLNRIFFIQPQ